MMILLYRRIQTEAKGLYSSSYVCLCFEGEYVGTLIGEATYVYLDNGAGVGVGGRGGGRGQVNSQRK